MRWRSTDCNVSLQPTRDSWKAASFGHVYGSCHAVHLYKAKANANKCKTGKTEKVKKKGRNQNEKMDGIEGSDVSRENKQR